MKTTITLTEQELHFLSMLSRGLIQVDKMNPHTQWKEVSEKLSKKHIDLLNKIKNNK